MDIARRSFLGGTKMSKNEIINGENLKIPFWTPTNDYISSDSSDKKDISSYFWQRPKNTQKRKKKDDDHGHVSLGCLLSAASTTYHRTNTNVLRRHQRASLLQRRNRGGGEGGGKNALTTTRAAGDTASSINETLELTGDNVEKVLDEVRPYLISDGGNVELVEIDGLVVKLRLQGACGSCPSSTVTMRMGIERRLVEKSGLRKSCKSWTRRKD